MSIKKILHVIEGIDSKRGGLPVAMFSINNIENELKIESHVLTTSINNSATESLPNTHHVFPISFPKRFYGSTQANAWLNKNIGLFDLVIIHGFWNVICVQSALTAIKFKTKFIIWPHGSLDPFDLQKKFLLKVILGKLVAVKIFRAAYKMCFTCKQESLLVETYGVPIDKVVLPLPVKKQEFSVQHESKDLFRKKYGIDADDFVFIFLGRLSYKKGIDKLIIAMSQLNVNYKNVKVLIVGHDKGPYARELKVLVTSLNLDRVITFCGELIDEDKAIAFYSSDCFVLPSSNENFGIATIEALQHGLPVIISKNVYIWEEIVSSNGGWVCEAVTSSLFKVMCEVLQNETEYLIKKAHVKQIGDSYLPKNLLDIYKNFYDSIK